MTLRGLSNDKSSLNLLLARLVVSLETVETEKTHTNIHAYVGFEPTNAVLERAKTVRALDRSATAIGIERKYLRIYSLLFYPGRGTR
jgi:hypothetical protein